MQNIYCDVCRMSRSVEMVVCLGQLKSGCSEREIRAEMIERVSREYPGACTIICRCSDGFIWMFEAVSLAVFKH